MKYSVHVLVPLSRIGIRKGSKGTLDKSYELTYDDCMTIIARRLISRFHSELRLHCASESEVDGS